MKKVLIAVPVFEHIQNDCFKSIYGLAIPQGTVAQFDFCKGYDCALARNKIAQESIDYGFDYCFMVDSDIILPQYALIKLLEADKDVILGWYHRKRTVTNQTEIFALGQYDFTDENNMYSNDIGLEVFEIKGGGMGCALIKTSVFTKPPYFKYVEYDDGSVLSEDNYFCSEFTKTGGKIYCHGEVKCGHISDIIL